MTAMGAELITVLIAITFIPTSFRFAFKRRISKNLLTVSAILC